MQWTEDQSKAIAAREGTLLVSAAAGSGKTAVLVERVLQRVLSGECDVDALLIVTFTRAATAQMQDKIAAALQKQIDRHPENAELRRQLSLLPFAHICTIDSFCGEIVRENFQQLGIEPDYTILDDNQLKIMREQAAAETVEQFYADDKDGVFGELCELLFRGRDDRRIIDSILELDEAASADADPEAWLHGLYAGYEKNTPLGETDWGKLALRFARRTIRKTIRITRRTLEMIASDEKVYAAYEPLLRAEIDAMEQCEASLCGTNWDEMRTLALSLRGRISAASPRIYKCDAEEKALALDCRRKNKERLERELEPLFCTSEAEYADDAAYCLPLIRKFADATLAFRRNLMEKKREANGYSFADVSLFALQCLRGADGSPSDYARQISQQFCEILVDEFQDVNGAQNALFRLLSRDEKNLFMVGDAKQCIYQFRQARPDIFMHMKRAYPLFAGGNYPSRVQLDRNFRSRTGVTDWVNYTFHQLMLAPEDPDVWDIPYEQSEYLYPAARYAPSATPDALLHVVRTTHEEDRLQQEARHVAAWIRTKLDEGLSVQDGETTRPATFGDFCILIRSDSGRIAKIGKVLESCDIPVQAGAQGGFFRCPEISFMTSLLQTLDNPLQDVPLLAVLLSPVFGFTPEDVARLRVTDRKASLYALVCSAAETDPRYAAFLQRIADLRLLSATLPAGELIRRLMDETGFFAVSGAMSGGAGRRANLRQLWRFALRYEQTGRVGLSGFVRFLDRLREQGENVDKARPVPGADVVQIMTIHRSKGLEFPFVIVMNCAGDFNEEELKNNYICHSPYGMAVVRRDPGKFVQYDTVPKAALTRQARLSAMNEELRVLYVAMTRAKEKLLMVVSLPNPEDRLRRLSILTCSDGTLTGVADLKNYGDMLLCACLRHPDAHALRTAAGLSGSLLTLRGNALTDFSLETVIADAPPEAQMQQIPHARPRPANPAVTESVCARTAYVYPFAALSLVSAKHAASEIETQGVDEAFFASARPAFLNAGSLTPAQRGTALHRFMQYADWEAASADAGRELERLLSSGLLSEAQGKVVPLQAVRRFFDSEVGRRVLSSPMVMREKRFAMQVPAASVYPELGAAAEGETVVIQGMVDCAFLENGKLYILDYKTDRETPQTLRARYAGQIAAYCDAMAACTPYPIGGAYLYSFHNRCVVEMPCQK